MAASICLKTAPICLFFEQAWAAAEKGLTGGAAEAFISSVIAADMEEKGDEDVFRKISGDLKAKGASVSDDMIRKKMAELTITAREQVLAEG